MKKHGVYYNGWLASNLDAIIKLQQQDHDTLLIVDGQVGSGKSVLAMQICKYLDPKFSTAQICFNGKEFRQLVMNSEKGRAILFDEAMSGLHSRSAISSENRQIVEMLAEVRQKNLFLVLCLPSFFDLDRNVALYRSRALIHTYLHKGQRGQFLFFGPKQKKRLYLEGKKFYNYTTPQSWTKPGDFTAAYVVDEQEYRKKKYDSMVSQYEDKQLPLLNEQDIVRNTKKAIAYRMGTEPVKDKYGISQDMIADILEVTPRTVRNYIAQETESRK